MSDLVEELRPYAERDVILVGTPPELLRRVIDELERLQQIVAVAWQVAEGGDTDDGMVEVKWDEMIRLRDALGIE